VKKAKVIFFPIFWSKKRVNEIKKRKRNREKKKRHDERRRMTEMA
jgi:hypothetical protein